MHEQISQTMLKHGCCRLQYCISVHSVEFKHMKTILTYQQNHFSFVCFFQDTLSVKSIKQKKHQSNVGQKHHLEKFGVQMSSFLILECMPTFVLLLSMFLMASVSCCFCVVCICTIILDPNDSNASPPGEVSMMACQHISR